MINGSGRNGGETEENCAPTDKRMNGRPSVRLPSREYQFVGANGLRATSERPNRRERFNLTV